MKKFLVLIMAVLMTASFCAFAEKEQGTTCGWETSDPETQVALEQIWQEAQKAAGKKAKTPRPRVCAREGVVAMELEGRPVLLCGYYSPERNDLLAVYDPALCGPFRCVLIHEFLHNIMGSGHVGHDKVMKKAGCSE